MRKKGVPSLPPAIGPEAVQILQDLNPWWGPGRPRQGVPDYLRRGVGELISRLGSPKGLVEILRGPRQVGKTTALAQAINHLLRGGVRPENILFVRFDQEVLRETRDGMIPIIRWFEREVRKKSLGEGPPAYLFLDEVHKLEKWDEDVKFLADTFPIRLVLTGSSSVLVARGGRESLAGRAYTTEMPTFQFREVLEAWAPELAEKLPPSISFRSVLEGSLDSLFTPYRTLRPQQTLSLKRQLDRYYNRGGYPRLYTGEVQDDLWADYLTQTIIDRVLGVDVPDLFPVQNPKLLRWIYVEIARSTGQEISQNRLAEWANKLGFGTSQPIIGRYMHYLADALLIREFRRYPLGKKVGATTPSKVTLTDLGARNALFRGAPSLWESPPEHVGALVETLAQSVMRGPGIQVHFYRDYEKKDDRRTPLREVDFVVEHVTGTVVPIEIKFRKAIGPDDVRSLRLFMERFKSPHGILVTRDAYGWDPETKVLSIPVLEFLLAF